MYLAVLLVVFGLSQLHGSVLAPDPYVFARTERLLWACAYAALLLGACYAVGLPGLARSARSAAASAAVAVSVAALGISSVQLLLGDALLPRFVVFGSALLIVPIVTGLTMVHRAGSDRAAARDRVFFIGGGGEREMLADELDAAPERPATLVGTHEPVGGMEGEIDRAVLDAIEASSATVVVLDLGAQADPEVVATVAAAHERGVRVRTLSLFYEEWLGKLPVSELERVSLLFDVGELHRARYARAKRVVDLVLGVAGAVVLLVVAPFVLVGNAVANRGPLLFRQTRVGKGGAEFTILKFRTMAPGAGDGEWTARDDHRVTRFGRILRTTHLDELPQVVNILRGDLSIVGPRPEQPRYVEELSEKLPFYRVRHLVRPGLTGWAQVKYGYAGDERDALEKLQYEFFYLRRQGLGLDLRIIGRTTRTVVGRTGR